jgi:hypothetical protein
MDGENLFRVSDRQRPQQDGADQAEDDGVAADAQRQREQCDKRETRALAQLAQSETEVLPEFFHESSAAHVPAHILDVAAIPETLLGATARFLRSHTAPDVFFGAQIDVELPLFGDFVMHLFTAHQRTQTHRQL